MREDLEHAELIREAELLEKKIKADCGGQKIGVAYLAIGRALGNCIAEDTSAHPFQEAIRMITEIAWGSFREAREAKRNG